MTASLFYFVSSTVSLLNSQNSSTFSVYETVFSDGFRALKTFSSRQLGIRDATLLPRGLKGGRMPALRCGRKCPLNLFRPLLRQSKNTPSRESKSAAPQIPGGNNSDDRRAGSTERRGRSNSS